MDYEKLVAQTSARKVPSMVIYWTDTKTLLTFEERQHIETHGTVLALTPLEVLFEDKVSGRKVAIRGLTDSHAPRVPNPR